ncbi:DUF3800 domain-containing protein [Pelistega ratti]|uniref:DUF3800 domain-containing protein n=1 Tax=Pelistega ratti TaxID=2652177 RepID=UPI00135826D2|nr:DUF3800 domain-containing protein [Pelistega ratti]
MQISAYLDESGDLGWKFDAPYRQGGSSRYLTIAAILIHHDKRHLLKRLMRDLYNKTKTPTNKEVKWAALTVEQRIWIANKLADFKIKHGNDVQYFCMTVNKEKVAVHIRQDQNKLYNYMVKCLLAKEFAKYNKVIFNIDQRTMKVQSGNSLHDYLQTTIWLDIGAETLLTTNQCDSKCHLGVQLADIISGIVQSHFEDAKSEPFNILEVHSEVKTLFF